MTPLEVVEKAVEAFKVKEGYSEAGLSMATIFVMTQDKRFVTVGESADVYEGLESIPSQSSQWLDKPSALGLLTSGWAAPLNENGEADGAPSEHIFRRRVYLLAVVTSAGMASAAIFGEDEVSYDTGSASGPLAEAMTEAFTNIK